METKKQTLEKRLNIIYQENRLTEPSDLLSEYGKKFLQNTKNVINDNMEEEQFISMAYFSNFNDDIIPRIRREAGNTIPLIRFNLVATDFLADLLVLMEHMDVAAMEYFASKYLRLKEEDENHIGYAKFYSWIYSQYVNKPEYNNSKYLPAAFIGSEFMVMHEWVHIHQDMLEDTLQLIKSTKEVLEICKDKEGNLNTQLMTEIACDFSALVLSSEKIYRREQLQMALVASFVPALYDNLIQLYWLNGKIDNDTLNKKIFENLETRIKPLCLLVKKAQNTTISTKYNMFFEDQDIETAGKVLILPSIWMRLMNEFITDRFAERQTEFNAMPEAEQMKENGCEYKQSNWILLA